MGTLFREALGGVVFLVQRYFMQLHFVCVMAVIRLVVTVGVVENETLC